MCFPTSPCVVDALPDDFCSSASISFGPMILELYSHLPWPDDFAAVFESPGICVPVFAALF